MIEYGAKATMKQLTEGSNVPLDTPKQFPRARMLCAFGLLVVAYALLYPGLRGKHFQFDYVVPSQAEFHITLGIWQISQRLLHCPENQPTTGLMGVLVFLWGIVFPLVKLIVCLLYGCGKELCCGIGSRASVVFVQKVSKWAMADSFMPAIWTALFNVRTNATEINSALFYSYYIFSAHVLLSILGMLLLRLPSDPETARVLDEESPETQSQFTRPAPPSQSQDDCAASMPLVVRSASAWEEISPSRACVVALALLAFLIALTTPIVSFETAEGKITGMVITRAGGHPGSTINGVDIIKYSSVLDFVASLWENAPVPAVVISLVVIVLPAADFAIGTAAYAGIPVCPNVEFLVEGFAMFDVLLVATVMSRLSVVVFKNYVLLHLLPAGWAIFALSLCWSVYTFAGRPRPSKS